MSLSVRQKLIPGSVLVVGNGLSCEREGVKSGVKVSRWSDDRSVFHAIDGAMLDEQKVKTRTVRLRFAWCGMCMQVLFNMHSWSNSVEMSVPLCVILVGIPVCVWHWSLLPEVELRPKFPGTFSIVNIIPYLWPGRTYGWLACLKQWVSEKNVSNADCTRKFWSELHIRKGIQHLQSDYVVCW